ncbi:hypothetical protein RN001_013115 [Aquatica leii]|uniref:Uncharacterized protein n=1 Tax=Aquatica leii TaxID=1421715 RepID=A0AAN7PZM4_9COLE|nr:hypothetical protein RN001_013115 [Aquatica leii]
MLLEKKPLGLHKDEYTNDSDGVKTKKSLNELAENTNQHPDDNLLSQAEVARLSLQLANIEPLYDLFSQVQDDIETTSDNLEIEYAETSAFEDKYFKLISVAKVYLANYDSTAVKSRSPNNSKQTTESTNHSSAPTPKSPDIVVIGECSENS